MCANGAKALNRQKNTWPLTITFRQGEPISLHQGRCFDGGAYLGECCYPSGTEGRSGSHRTVEERRVIRQWLFVYRKAKMHPWSSMWVLWRGSICKSRVSTVLGFSFVVLWAFLWFAQNMFILLYIYIFIYTVFLAPSRSSSTPWGRCSTNREALPWRWSRQTSDARLMSELGLFVVSDSWIAFRVSLS